MEMIIDGVEYIPKKDDKELMFCIVRTYSAGVFAGKLESRNGQEVTLRDAIRLWSWQGAASLSQMAVSGTVAPDKCKFAIAVDKVLLLQAIEILECTKNAEKSIKGVKTWIV